MALEANSQHSLYLGCQIPTDANHGSADSFHWKDPAIPSLLTYDFIFAAAPPDDPELLPILNELSLALSAGAMVVLLPPSGALERRKILGVTFEPLRKKVGPSSITCDNPLLGEFFIECGGATHQITVSSDAEVVAYCRSEAVPLACLSYFPGSPGVLLALASNYDWEGAGLPRIFNLIENYLSSTNSPEATSLWRLKKLTITLFVIFILIFSLRLRQRFINQEEIVKYSEATILEIDERSKLNILQRQISPEELRAVIEEPPEPDNSSMYNPCWAWRAYSRLGLYGHEDRLIKAIEKTGELAFIRGCGFDVFEESVRANLYAGFPETARYRAQKAIQLSEMLPGSDISKEVSRFTGAMRNVVELTRDSFLYHDEVDDNSARTLYECVLSRTCEDLILPSAGWITSRLGDEFDYYGVLSRIQTSALDDSKANVWIRFLEDHPGSRKADEASFNILVTTMNSWPTLVPDFSWESRELSLLYARPELRELDRKSAKLSSDFIEDFPDSYLADDALIYYIRVLHHLGESESAWKELARLFRRYPKSDGARSALSSLRIFLIRRLRSEDLVERSENAIFVAAAAAGDGNRRTTAPLEIRRTFAETGLCDLDAKSDAEIFGGLVDRWLANMHGDFRELI